MSESQEEKVSSTIQQQRAAARARLERQMAEKLEQARKRKQRNAIIGAAAALVVVVASAAWIISMVGGEKQDDPTVGAPAGDCQWFDEDTAANPNLKDVGRPPVDVAKNGTQAMTIETNKGTIEVEVNTAKAPCTAASMTYLAGQKFFDDTKCHRLTTEGIKVLQCGDPSATGAGGPTYKLAEENLPNFTDPKLNYPAGTIAMAKTQAPNSTGSQFFIVYGDTELPGDYTVLGKITKGLDVVEKIGAKGAVGEDGKATPDGKPKEEVVIKTLTVSAPQG